MTFTLLARAIDEGNDDYDRTGAAVQSAEHDSLVAANAIADSVRWQTTEAIVGRPRETVASLPTLAGIIAPH